LCENAGSGSGLKSIRIQKRGFHESFVTQGTGLDLKLK
jgi:hypothetical protein